VQVPHGSERAWGFDVIYVEMPSGEVEVSSSYDLSIFSLGANPQFAKSVTPEGSSLSIGELWPEIDKLDVIDGKGTNAVNIPEVVLHDEKSLASAKKIDKYSRRQGKGALPSDAPGPSDALPKSRGKRSVKMKAMQILSIAPRSIFPHMQRLFVDRRHSPSTGMGLSEWEIILDELIRMEYVLKKEPDSDCNE
jgi:hypothetical protein